VGHPESAMLIPAPLRRQVVPPSARPQSLAPPKAFVRRTSYINLLVPMELKGFQVSSLS
jgi:hypothetical protein